MTILEETARRMRDAEATLLRTLDDSFAESLRVEMEHGFAEVHRRHIAALSDLVPARRGNGDES